MLRRSSGAESDGTNLTDASGFAASTADQSHEACDDDYVSIDDDAPLEPVGLPETHSTRPVPPQSPQDAFSLARAEADARAQAQSTPVLPKKRSSKIANFSPFRSSPRQFESAGSPRVARSSPLTHNNLEAHILSNAPTHHVAPCQPESVSTGSECEVCHFKETKQSPVLMICQMKICKRAYHPNCVLLPRAPEGEWFCTRCRLDCRELKRTATGRLQLQACVLKNDDEEDDDAPLVDVRSVNSDDSCDSACNECRGKQKPDQMLQCEGRCKKFFHTWCVGLYSVPKGKWLCRSCVKAPTINKGGTPRKVKQSPKSNRKVKQSPKSKTHEEDMQAKRQWKMAMGIAAVGDADGPALSDSEDSGAPAAEEDDEASDADDLLPGNGTPAASKEARKVVAFGFSTPSFFDCTQTLRPGRRTWEDVGRVSEEALKLSLNCLPEQLVQERDILLAKHEEMFPWWHYMLVHGFNLLLYGVGSKRRILDSLSHILTDGVVVSVYAYMPAFRAKFMLLALCQALKLEHSVHASNSILVQIISLSLSPPPPPPPPPPPSLIVTSSTVAVEADKPVTRADARMNLLAQLKKVYILIHGFDSQQHHGGELMTVLASLAQCPKIGLVCGCDHVNAALVVSAAQRRQMRFMWVQATTFDPFTQELNSSVQSSGITVEHMQGSLAVIRALPSNSQKIVFELVRKQLAAGGATYAELHNYGRQHYFSTSDAALKNILVSSGDSRLLSF